MLNQKGLALIVIVLVVLLVLSLGSWLIYKNWPLKITKPIAFYVNPDTGECLLKPQKNINEEFIGKGFDEFVGTKPIDCKIWKCTYEGGLWNPDTLSCICPNNARYRSQIYLHQFSNVYTVRFLSKDLTHIANV